MDDSIYREHILEHYKHPQNFGSLEEFNLFFVDSNPLCGDQLGVQIQLEDNKIQDLRFQGQGCAISQAAASMLSEELIGLPVKQAIKLDKDFVLELLGIDISATRMKCALLCLKVVKSALIGAAADWPDADYSEQTP